MARTVSIAEEASASAPRYQVQERQAMAVEHPCIVRNVDKAVSMIGGMSAISRSHREGQDAPLNLRFHPDDPTSRPVVSAHIRSNNVLLQVTVPRRTGRKRKRGSDGPFLEDLNDPAAPKDTGYVLRSLQDNPNGYSIKPLATVSSSHVWRTMPDFVYSTAQSSFLKDIQEKVLPISYPLLKEYRLPQTYGLTNTEVVPPSQFSNKSIPTSYSYRSNPLMHVHTDPVTGEQTLYQGHSRRLNHNISIQWYQRIPTSTSPLLAPLSTQDSKFQTTVNLLHSIFATRPIWTKRALINQLPSKISLLAARSALSHVAFSFRSGPWRDTVCALGVDPRSDPKCRIYQSLVIQLVRKQGRIDGTIDDDEDPFEASRSWKRSEDVRSHIFTGQGEIPLDGKIWQVCDILDPQLAGALHLKEGEVVDVCEARTRGFYPAGAWAKLKIALKYKVAAMRKGKVKEFREPIDRFLTLPNVWDGEGAELKQGEVSGGYLPIEWKGLENSWSTLWRGHVKKMIRVEEEAKGKGKGRGKCKQVRFSEVVEDGSSEMGSTLDAEKDDKDEDSEDGDANKSGDEDDDEESDEEPSSADVFDESQSRSQEPDAAILSKGDVPMDTASSSEEDAQIV